MEKTGNAFDSDRAIKKSLRTWYPKDHPLHLNPHHPLGKLLGEWGELLDDYMKSLYKPDYVFKPEDELGDIWYYLRILCYQFDCIPHVSLISPKADEQLEILISVAINEISLVFVGVCNDIAPNSMFIEISYNLILIICKRYNLTLDQLTASNWQKLKPGSERGDQWMKARLNE